MKVLFILPNIVGDKGKPTAPSPGISYIAAFLLKNNHEVSVVDMRIFPKTSYIFDKISRFRPDFIGISFMTKEYLKSYKLIKQIKEEFPDIPLILGGPHPSTVEEKVLEDTPADLAVMSEGEETFLEICNGVLYPKIKGLIWRKDKKIIKNEKRPFIEDLDSLPFPAYELFPMEKYVDKKIPIVSSRGCPYQCIYCAMKKVMGAKWRARSAENVFNEIRYWYNKSYSFFHIVDDNFTLDMERAERICDLIIKNNLKIKWDLRNGVRVDRLNERLLEKMKKAGCFYLALGIESFDSEVLKKMKKGSTRERSIEAIKLVKKVGIPVGAFFMVGLPGDTFNKFLETYKLAKSMDLEEVRFYNVVPFPETELFDIIKEKGQFLKDPSEYLNLSSKFLNDPIYDLGDFTKEQKIKALDLGQNIVMKKLLKKEFGTILGSLAFLGWKIKPLRKLLEKIGIFIWALIRKSERE
jgi:radical SAM superfamily enzyme YgiQ (UPF0313 family)